MLTEACFQGCGDGLLLAVAGKVRDVLPVLQRVLAEVFVQGVGSGLLASGILQLFLQGVGNSLFAAGIADLLLQRIGDGLLVAAARKGGDLGPVFQELADVAGAVYRSAIGDRGRLRAFGDLLGMGGGNGRESKKCEGGKVAQRVHGRSRIGTGDSGSGRLYVGLAIMVIAITRRLRLRYRLSRYFLS